MCMNSCILIRCAGQRTQSTAGPHCITIPSFTHPTSEMVLSPDRHDPPTRTGQKRVGNKSMHRATCLPPRNERTGAETEKRFPGSTLLQTSQDAKKREHHTTISAIFFPIEATFVWRSLAASSLCSRILTWLFNVFSFFFCSRKPCSAAAAAAVVGTREIRCTQTYNVADRIRPNDVHGQASGLYGRAGVPSLRARNGNT